MQRDRVEVNTPDRIPGSALGPMATAYREASGSELQVQPYAQMQKRTEEKAAEPGLDIDQSDGNTRVVLTRHERNYINLLAVCVLIESMAYFMVPPILPDYRKQFSLSEEDIALLLGLRSFTAIAWCIPMGFLLPIFTLRSLLVVSFVLFAGGSLLFAFPQNWQMLAGGCFIQGLAMMTIRTGAFSFVAHLYSGPQSSSNGSAGADLPDTPGNQSPNRRADQQSTGPQGSDSCHAPSDGAEASAAEGEPGRGTLSEDPMQGQGFRAQSEGPGRGSGSGKQRRSVGGKASSFVGTLGFLYCWVSVGGMVGPVGGSFLYEYSEPWIPFTVTAVLDLLMAFIVLTIPEPKQRELGFSSAGGTGEVGSLEMMEGGLAKEDSLGTNGKPEENEPQKMTKYPRGPSSVGVVRPLWVLLVTVFGEPLGAGVMVIAFIQCVAWGILEVIVPTFLEGPCKYDTSVAGIAIGLNNLVYALVALGAGPIVGFLGSGLTITLGGLVMGLGFPFLAQPKVSCILAVQFLVNSAIGVGFAFIETPLFPTLCKVLIPHKVKNLPLLLGTYQFVYFLGCAVGPFAAAALFVVMQSWGISVVTSVLLFCALIFWTWARARK